MSKSRIKFGFVFAMTIGVSAAQADGFENNARVRRLAEAGVADVKHTRNCPQRFGAEGLALELGSATSSHGSLCVSQVELPANVRAEVSKMEEAQLKNLSDYDQRVTKLVVLKQEDLRANWVPTGRLAQLAKAFGVTRTAQRNGALYGALRVDARSFDNLEGLYVGEEFTEKPEVLKYLRELMKDKVVFSISWSDGVELYPGGGLRTSFTVYIADDILVYVKGMSWDS